jgi:hypothetical protein
MNNSLLEPSKMSTAIIVHKSLIANGQDFSKFKDQIKIELDTEEYINILNDVLIGNFDYTDELVISLSKEFGSLGESLKLNQGSLMWLLKTVLGRSKEGRNLDVLNEILKYYDINNHIAPDKDDTSDPTPFVCQLFQELSAFAEHKINGINTKFEGKL